jgi:hypothetical protein
MAWCDWLPDQRVKRLLAGQLGQGAHQRPQAPGGLAGGGA